MGIKAISNYADDIDGDAENAQTGAWTGVAELIVDKGKELFRQLK